MSRATFKILFYLKRNAPKKNGLVPVMCRITVNGKIAQFSCKLDVEEKMWSVETGRLTGRSNVALEGNRMLDKIRVGVNKAYQDVFDRDTYVTAEKVRNEYLGMGMNHKTLLAVFRQHNEDYAKLVGKMKSQRSYWKYCVVYKHLSEFIKTRYKVEDIALKELAPAFITDFELFLRVEKGHCTNTVWSYMMPFRSIIFTAINNGWLQRDPFYAYHITKEETKRGYLTKEEITQMINCTFKRKNYELIRDLFIFCCFTGLSWRDMANLTEENLQVSFDGHLWIKTSRQKTGVETNIRLLDVAKHIIDSVHPFGKAAVAALLGKRPHPVLQCLHSGKEHIEGGLLNDYYFHSFKILSVCRKVTQPWAGTDRARKQWQLVALFIVPHQDMTETDGLECRFGGFP